MLCRYYAAFLQSQDILNVRLHRLGQQGSIFGLGRLFQSKGGDKFGSFVLVQAGIYFHAIQGHRGLIDERIGGGKNQAEEEHDGERSKIERNGFQFVLPLLAKHFIEEFAVVSQIGEERGNIISGIEMFPQLPDQTARDFLRRRH